MTEPRLERLVTQAKRRKLRWLLAAIASAFVIVHPAGVMAEDECRYEFSSPTLEGLLQPRKVERLVIVMRNGRVDTRNAAKALSFEARKRGIQVVLMRVPQKSSPHSIAVEEARDKEAELVVLVQALPRAVQRAASADFRDPSGETVAVLAGVPTGSERCRDDGAALSREGRDAAEVAAIGNEQAELSGGPSGAGGAMDRPSSEGPGHMWYGWQLVLVDAGSALLLFLPEPRFALVPYALGAPSVHALNGQGTRAGLSLGLRVLVPAAAAGLGAIAARAGACERGDGGGVCGGALLGGAFLLGMALAAVVDDAVIAWKVKQDLEARFAGRGARRFAGEDFAVGMIPYRQGAGIGVSGRF
jgi:hypothetical protein